MRPQFTATTSVELVLNDQQRSQTSCLPLASQPSWRKIAKLVDHRNGGVTSSSCVVVKNRPFNAGPPALLLRTARAHKAREAAHDQSQVCPKNVRVGLNRIAYVAPLKILNSPNALVLKAKVRTYTSLLTSGNHRANHSA
jgi:hypothetical protein